MLVVQLYKGRGRHPWFLRLVQTTNGQVLATSEGYLARFNARRAAARNFSGIKLIELPTASNP